MVNCSFAQHVSTRAYISNAVILTGRNEYYNSSAEEKNRKPLPIFENDNYISSYNGLILAVGRNNSTSILFTGNNENWAAITVIPDSVNRTFEASIARTTESGFEEVDYFKGIPIQLIDGSGKSLKEIRMENGSILTIIDKLYLHSFVIKTRKEWKVLVPSYEFEY